MTDSKKEYNNKYYIRQDNHRYHLTALYMCLLSIYVMVFDTKKSVSLTFFIFVLGGKGWS